MEAGPPQLSTMRRARAPGGTRRLDAFPAMAIMMMLPLVVGAMATLVNSWSGFIEAAFMDMTLTLEGFDYKFGPAECGGVFDECGNSTFDSYKRARDLSVALFILALVAVAIKDMLRGGMGDLDLGAVDTKTLPEMLKYSVLVMAFLFVFPPVWDAASGTMNNVGIWILNPHYDISGKGGYIHGAGGRGEMCVGDIAYDDLAGLAPYARDADAWAVYRDGASGPMRNGAPSLYGEADNYVIGRGEVLSRECLHDVDQCPDAVSRPVTASAYQIGDILCNPDHMVKYVFRQALGVAEMDAVSPEQVLGAVTGVGGDDILVMILTQFIKSSVTLQIIMVVFMTGTMVDVVLSFALAILPIVPFYRFLPMSDKVRLGDYSGAAFALLAMPLVASLVLVAGAGAVANMAADDGEAFGSFFTWLAALSVVLLVVGIPATMVPLIGSAQMQATAAIQTGVQTASFAASTAAATVGGAIRGRREGTEFRRLAGMGPESMSPEQRARYDMLKEAGHDKMSMARAALRGGAAGARGQMFDESGRPTQAFRNVAMPGTADLTGASVRGLGGFEGGDATRSVYGIADSLGTAAADAAAAAGKAAPRKPTKEDLLQNAREREAEAEAELNDAADGVEDALDAAGDAPGWNEATAGARRADELAEAERGSESQAVKNAKKARAKMRAAEARAEDLGRRVRVLEGRLADAKTPGEWKANIERDVGVMERELADPKTSPERRARIGREMGERMGELAEADSMVEAGLTGGEMRAGFAQEMERAKRDMAGASKAARSLEASAATLDAEAARAGEAARRHTSEASAAWDGLAGRAASGEMAGAVGAAITGLYAAKMGERAAQRRYDDASSVAEDLDREVGRERRRERRAAPAARELNGVKETKPPEDGGTSKDRHRGGTGGGGSGGAPPKPPEDPPEPPPPPAAAASMIANRIPPAQGTQRDGDGDGVGQDGGGDPDGGDSPATPMTRSGGGPPPSDAPLAVHGFMPAPQAGVDADGQSGGVAGGGAGEGGRRQDPRPEPPQHQDWGGAADDGGGEAAGRSAQPPDRPSGGGGAAWGRRRGRRGGDPGAVSGVVMPRA